MLRAPSSSYYEKAIKISWKDGKAKPHSSWNVWLLHNVLLTKVFSPWKWISIKFFSTQAVYSFRLNSSNSVFLAVWFTKVFVMTDEVFMNSNPKARHRHPRNLLKASAIPITWMSLEISIGKKHQSTFNQQQAFTNHYLVVQMVHGTLDSKRYYKNSLW